MNVNAIVVFLSRVRRYMLLAPVAVTNRHAPNIYKSNGAFENIISSLIFLSLLE